MSRKPIQLFTPSYRIEECLDEIRKCLEVGWTGLGFKTIEFEDAWKTYTGHSNAHFLNSATVGLQLAIKILKDSKGWQDGDEIISTPITFVSTNHAILYENLKVIFADIDIFGCLEPKSVLEKISERTRAVVFVGLGGNIGQLEAVKQICRDKNISLILDAAHMAGTRSRGTTPGLDVEATVYSFQAVKNLPTADSGMICFTDPQLDATARKLSWLGIDKDTFSRTNSGGSYKWYYDVDRLGFKSHGNSIMAAIGLAQLKYLDADNAYRRQLSLWYDEYLTDSSHIRVVPVAPNCESSRHLYQVRVNKRDEILLALNNAGIFPGVHYRDNTEFSFYKEHSGECPNARLFSDEVISLPMHLKITRQDISYVCENLLDIVS